MVAEGLVRVIEEVRGRAQRYQQELAGSEAMTRYVLIDPILRALGWQLDDPAMVRPEYAAGQGRADYCLFAADGKPAVLIEAKTLGPKLPPIASAAVVSYAWELSRDGTHVEYVGITNGMLWQVYRFPDVVRPAHTVDLGRGTAAEAAVEILRALWHPLLAGDSKLPSPPTPPPPRVGELPLSELHPTPGSPPPSALLLPDGTEVPLQWWRDLLVETARALVRAGKLSPQRCPVRLSGAQARCLVHTEPVHPNGQRFRSPGRLDERLWIETHASADSLVTRARRLLEQFGEDPSRYRVRFDQPGQQP
jgi:hypothetical protein